MNYQKLVDNGSLPEFITVDQIVKAVDGAICPNCVRNAIEKNYLDAKKLDNGDYLVNTVSALEYFDYLDHCNFKKDQQSRVIYLMELKVGEA